MKTFALLTSVAFIALPGMALAADLIVEAPAPVAEPSDYWDGPYAGLHVGYGWGDFEPTDGPGDVLDDISGWLIGAQAGVNFKVDDNLVLGVEGDIDWADISASMTEELDGELPVTATLDYGVDALASLRGRIGFAADSLLIYATAGLGFGHGYFESSVNDGETISADAWHIGWAAGVGVEAMVTDTISLKAEYLHYGLGEAEYDPGDDLTPEDFDIDVDTVKFGFNVHF